MKLGLALGPEVGERFSLARNAGIEGLMVFGHEIADKNMAKDLLRRFAEEGARMAQIGCWSFNPAMPDENAAAEVRRAIELAGQAGNGCTVVFAAGGVHPSGAWVAHPDNWTPEARKRVAQSVRPLAKLAAEVGVRLVLEPHLVNVAGNGQTSRELLETIGAPNVGICADLVNYCTFDDLWDNRRLMDSVFGPLAGRCFAAHLKDVAIEERLIVHMNECPAGQGKMDFVALLSRLDKLLARTDWAIIEHTPPEKVSDTVRYVMDKAREADVRFA